MKKIPAVQKLSHLQDAFIKCIQVIMVGYVEGQVIFDRYLDLFLKNKTSQERAVYLHRIWNSSWNKTMSLKELLSDFGFSSSGWMARNVCVVAWHRRPYPSSSPWIQWSPLDIKLVYREINVVERVQVIGHRKCQCLIGIRNFSGVNYVWATKKTWVSDYL